MKKTITMICGAVCALFLMILGGTSFSSCTAGSASSDSTAKPVPLNITVFLDLSNRLDSSANNLNSKVPQMERDTAIINKIVSMFVDTCVAHKIADNENHLQVQFHPMPQSSDIAAVAANLNIDMAAIKQPKEKKSRLMKLQDDFSKNVALIYDQTLKDQNWQGSDIWGFFCNKNPKVDQLCIREGYRNIIVILTDGYVQYLGNMKQDGNSYSYITPDMIKKVPEISLMAPRQGLDNLEVLMLEVNPLHSSCQEKLISVLEQWLKNMGVKHYVVTETDGNKENTKTIIENFFKGK